MHHKISDQQFEVEGKKALHGKVRVSGSKNATLPILCAALLTKEKSILTNVPDIADVHTLLKIFEHLNVKTTFEGNTITVDPSNLKYKELKPEDVCSLRASILLLGPILARQREIILPFPGGCVLGKRPVFAHTHALKTLGAEVIEADKHLHLRAQSLHPAKIIMSEVSVTATENACMAAALTPGKTIIRLAAGEPHVQDLCKFLNAMGAKITGLGTHFLEIEGADELHGTEHKITGDYLEAGTMAIAALVTHGEIIVEGINTNHLDSFWQKLEEAGAEYELYEDSFRIFASEKLRAISNLQTAVYPSFPTDLQAPFGVLLTQAQGESKIFETLFDGRLNYLHELEQMGAKVEVLNPHQAKIKGPVKLKGTNISSLDLRAGAAMVLAALCAEGKTLISNINYIDRGYEKFDEKLRSLGANIKRIKTE
jgi:UDP-N-acetylglucosamine 1-carboxyvinyltransferase